MNVKVDKDYNKYKINKAEKVLKILNESKFNEKKEKHHLIIDLFEQKINDPKIIEKKIIECVNEYHINFIYT